MTIPSGVVDVATQCAIVELRGLLRHHCDVRLCEGCKSTVRRAVVAAFEFAGFSVEKGGDGERLSSCGVALALSVTGRVRSGYCAVEHGVRTR